MDQLITLKIDGKEVSVPAGTTVLAAARKLGIHIPTFCDYAKLTPQGAFRMCLVEVEKIRGSRPPARRSCAPIWSCTPTRRR